MENPNQGQLGHGLSHWPRNQALGIANDGWFMHGTARIPLQTLAKAAIVGPDNPNPKAFQWERNTAKKDGSFAGQDKARLESFLQPLTPGTKQSLREIGLVLMLNIRARNWKSDTDPLSLKRSAK